MRKALSLILAVVMVALMIPFAAFTTAAADPFYKVWDFTNLTPDDGADKDINPSLPKGVQAQTGKAIALNWEGVDINEAYASVGLDANAGLPEGIVNGTTDYIMEFTWNVTNKVSQIRFGWKTTAPVYTAGANGAAGTSTLVNTSAAAMAWNANNLNNAYVGPGSRGIAQGKMFNKYTAYDAQGNQIDFGKTDHYADFTDGVCAGVEYTFSIVVRDGLAKQIYVYSEGALVRRYDLETEYAAVGYFQVWAHGGGSFFNVKSFAVKEIGEEETSTAPIYNPVRGQVVHNVDMSKVANADALPYSLVQDRANGGSVWFENGTLNQTVVGQSSSKTFMNGVKLDKELFAGAGKNFTLDFTIAGGSKSRILMVAFGMDDDIAGTYADANCFKFRFRDANKYQCDGFSTYVYDADAKAWTQANADNIQGLPAEMVENIEAGEDINVKIVVNQVVSVAYITVKGQTVKAIDTTLKADKKANTDKKILVDNADAGDVMILQNANSSNLVAIKNVKIVNSAVYYGTEMPTSDAQILMPANTSVVKNDGIATFTAVGTEVTPAANVVAQRVNGGDYTAPAKVNTEAGKIYSFVDASKLTLAAGAASLRDEEGNTAIRFTSVFNASDLQTLVDLYEAGIVSKVEVGTLITTTPWAEAAGEVTHAALDDIANGKTAYIEVEATINQWYATNTFAGSVITSNVDREYQAVGFINVELANGANLVVYSAVTASDLATLTPEEA